VREGRIDQPYLTFSFDDGLKSCRRAAEILALHGASACFFVCPPMASETNHSRIEAFCRSQLDMPPTEFLSWEDMEYLIASGHEIGSHTMRHLQLSDLKGEELDDELGESRSLLMQKLGAGEHFAWPFGRFSHMSREAKDRVFAAGYESCASAERGAHVKPMESSSSKEALCIRRDQIIAAWPLSHTRLFMARSSLRADGAMNDWPDSLRSVE
ncbi:MAG: polysaccharide deacetylase family protein, partial [bacterium]